MKLPNPSTAMLLPAALVVAGLATAAAPSSGGTAPVARVVDDAAERYEALDQEAGEAISEWSQAWRKAYFAARDAGEQPPARPPSPAIEFGAKFLEAAADYAGTDDAVPFLGWVVISGVEKAHVTSAVATITASHLESELFHLVGHGDTTSTSEKSSVPGCWLGGQAGLAAGKTPSV